MIQPQSILAVFLLGLASIAWGQQAPDQNSDNDRGGRSDRGDRGDRGGRGDRDRGDRNRWDDPDRREEMYNSIVQRYARNISEAYQLTPEEREQVRQKLEQLRVEHEKHAAPFREEMRKQREAAGEGESPWRNPEFRDRMAELWRSSPLLNSQKVIEQVEPILPPDKVQKGHERWQQMEGERWGGRGGDRDGRRGNFINNINMDRWQRYVEYFTRVYQLDAAQKASADSVLRDMTQQRDTYRQSHQAEFTAAEQIEDRDARREKFNQLNEPIDRMYNELRSKLDQIPTTAQKEVARATSRPAGSATTRPSGRDRGDRRDRDRSRDGDSGGDDRRFN